MDKKYSSTRALYKAVKKYDHQQFDDFCMQIYQEGFEEGKKSVKGIEIDRVLEIMSGIKGIGPALHKKISDALNEEFEKMAIRPLGGK